MKKDKSYSHYLFIQAKKQRDVKNSHDAFNAYIKYVPIIRKSYRW